MLGSLYAFKLVKNIIANFLLCIFTTKQNISGLKNKINDILEIRQALPYKVLNINYSINCNIHQP